MLELVIELPKSSLAQGARFKAIAKIINHGKEERRISAMSCSYPVDDFEVDSPYIDNHLDWVCEGNIPSGEIIAPGGSAEWILTWTVRANALVGPHKFLVSMRCALEHERTETKGVVSAPVSIEILPAPRSVAELAADLDSKDDYLRDWAREALLPFGDEAVPALARAVKRVPDDIDKSAFSALKAIGSPRAVAAQRNAIEEFLPTIRGMLKSKSMEEVQSGLFLAIRYLPHTNKLKPLIEPLVERESLELRISAAVWLLEGDRESIDDRFWARTYNVLDEALTELTSQNPPSFFIHDNVTGRSEVLHLIAALPSEPRLRFLRRSLQHPNYLVAEDACEVVAELKLRELLPDLKEARRGANPVVQYSATNALMDLGVDDPGYVQELIESFEKDRTSPALAPLLTMSSLPARSAISSYVIKLAASLDALNAEIEDNTENFTSGTRGPIASRRNDRVCNTPGWLLRSSPEVSQTTRRDDPRPMVLQQLAELGRRAEPALPAVINALSSPNVFVYGGAVNTLRAINSQKSAAALESRFTATLAAFADDPCKFADRLVYHADRLGDSISTIAGARSADSDSCKCVRDTLVALGTTESFTRATQMRCD